MLKKQKTIDIWFAIDGSEHLSEHACVFHEEKLQEEQVQTELQIRLRANEEAWKQRVEAVKTRWEEHPEEKELLLQQTKAKNDEGMQIGITGGWWESLDDRGHPVPWADLFIIKHREIKRMVWKSSKNFAWETIDTLDVHENTMAHIVHRISWFDSVGEARKNGWNRPIEVGEFKFKKQNKRLIVLEE